MCRRLGFNDKWSFRGSMTFKGVKFQPLETHQGFGNNGYLLCSLMLRIKWIGWLSEGAGRVWRQFGEEQTQCPCRADPFVRGSGQWSEGIWTHFINRVQSVDFKENHPRVCYLYKCRTLNVGLHLPYLLITVSWHDHHGWWCRCLMKIYKRKPLISWV